MCRLDVSRSDADSFAKNVVPPIERNDLQERRKDILQNQNNGNNNNRILDIISQLIS
jgi:hypothetical protein